MIWLVWRQHRTEVLMTLGVLDGCAAFLLVTSHAMADTLQQSGLSACLVQGSASSSTCSALAALFVHDYGPLIPFATAMLLLPGLLGAMVGAPLVAREYEQQTQLLAWMQSITRSRWLAWQLALVLGGGLLVGIALLAMLIRWYSPFDQLIGKFNPVAFDFSGPVLIAATVMSLALGIAAGAATRRTVAAIFLTLALLVAIHVIVDFNLRANDAPQITVTWALTQGPTVPITLSKEDWQVASGFLDAQGNRTDSVYCNGSGQTPQQCMQADGYRGYYLAYQPADRFWPFQWIETGIFLAIAAVAVALTSWLVRRRLA